MYKENIVRLYLVIIMISILFIIGYIHWLTFILHYLIFNNILVLMYCLCN